MVFCSSLFASLLALSKLACFSAHVVGTQKICIFTRKLDGTVPEPKGPQQEARGPMAYRRPLFHPFPSFLKIPPFTQNLPHE
jgi:hypothetical protein